MFGNRAPVTSLSTRKGHGDLFRRAVEQAPTPMILYDDTGEVWTVSSGWTHFSGYTLDDIPTIDDWTERAYGERRGAIRDYIDTLFDAGGTVHNGEWTVRTKHGEQRTWDIHTRPLGIARGQRRVILSTASDVTDRKRFDAELLAQLDHVRRSNEALEHFAATCAHDLKEPLRAINNYLQLLVIDSKDRLDARGQEYIRVVTAAAMQLYGRVDDLFLFTSIGSDREETEGIEAQGIVADVLAGFENWIRGSGAEISVGALPRVRATPEHLRQIFRHLISNALKYSGEHHPRLSISAETSEAGVRFDVRDEGVGIDPTRRDQLFACFGHASSGEVGSGLGLGLAICRRIVEHWGGRIWVEPAPSRGSTFSFTIPARHPVAVAAPAPGAVPS